MKRINYDKFAFPYILECISSEGYREEELKTDQEKLQFLADTFKAEYLHCNNQHINKQTLFADWCQGLPSCFNIEWENYKILELAKSWGSLPDNATEKQEQKILNDYWYFIAWKVFKMFRRYKVTL